MNTTQRQSINQNLTNMLAETADFSDIYRQDYSGCFREVKDYIYLKGEKYRQQDNSLANNFSFLHIKNELLAFLFSLSKGIYNTWAKYTQINSQTSVARNFFAEVFEIFSTSIN